MWQLLLACLSLVAAQNASVFSFSGNFTSAGASLTTIQISTSTGDCDTSSSGYYYTTFPVEFATAGFRTVVGAGFDFLGFVAGNSLVLNTTNPCNSTPALFPLTKTGLSNNLVSFGHYFPVGNYTFVLASIGPVPFIGEVWEGMFNGQTVNKTETWQPLYKSSSAACSVYGYQYNYDAQRFTVATTGYYTLTLAFAQNTTAAVDSQVPNGVALTVLAGDHTMTNFSALDCTAAAADFVTGAYSGSYVTTVQAFEVHLTAGMNYTLVASAYSTYGGQAFAGRYSLVVAPQVYIPFKAVAAFSPPQSYACDGTVSGCNSQNPPAFQNHAYTAFTVPKHSWFYLYGNQLSKDGINSADLEYYIYSEDNSNLLPCGSYLGATCMKARDTLDGLVYYSGSYTNFSVIATGYYDTLGDNGILSLVVLKGPALPAFLTTDAPTAPTTLAPTTIAPTVAPTTAAPTPAGQTSAPTTRMPTVAGQTNAPTTRMPTIAGQTYAPTTATPTAPTTTPVTAASALHVPCAAVLGLALFMGL